MKKMYIKPYVHIEDFSLSANIATGCEYKSNHAMYECSYLDNGWNVFTSNISACDDLPLDDNTDSYLTDDGDTICYHTFTSEVNIFTS